MMRSLILAFCAIAVLAGCVHEETAKSSHFEHDHEVAEHWPVDLKDAVEKIRERLAELDRDASQSQKIAAEITDIVSWVPEIAADTDLSEQQWIPLDDAAQALSAQLAATDNAMTQSLREQVEAFCDLLSRTP